MIVENSRQKSDKEFEKCFNKMKDFKYWTYKKVIYSSQYMDIYHINYFYILGFKIPYSKCIGWKNDHMVAFKYNYLVEEFNSLYSEIRVMLC